MAADTSSSTQQSMSERADVDHDLNNSSTHHSLSRAVQARKFEFVRPHRIRIKVGSWNVAACPGTDKDLASWFVDGQGLEPRFDTHLADESLRESGALEDVLTSDDDVPNREGEGSDKVQNKSNDTEFVAISKKEDGKTHSKKLEPKSQIESEGPMPDIRIVGGTDIGLYVLGLQEIISLNIIAGYADTSATAKWQAALEAAMPPYYKLIATQQLSGLLLLIYASPDVAASISDVSTVSVGTGLLGYMGNKGGVSTRIMLGETTRLVFTNCHLASGNDQGNLDRRHWDYNRILTQTQFSPINHGSTHAVDEGEKIGDEDFAFWFGDLNFRLDGLPGDDIRHLLMLHTRGEYDVSRKDIRSIPNEDGVIIMHNKTENDSDGTDTPGMVSREASFDRAEDDHEELPDPDDFVPDPHDDPASLQATIDSLLPHDQLARTIKDRKAFHEGWREGAITFLPSYKYDIGTVGLFDSSEKRRAPSWCDRILFRTRADLEAHKAKLEEEAASRRKDDDMKKRGIDTAGDDESVLFDYDPDNEPSSATTSENLYDYDEYEEAENEAVVESDPVITKEGYQDHLQLDLYTTHQRISSSDHKPIVALFTLDYDAVVPELKAQVHAEVARELDRAENEGRPGITIIVDGQERVSKDTEGVDDGSGGVDLGEVGFLSPVTQSLTIANTGRVPATLCFVEKPSIGNDTTNEEPKPTEAEWLHVSLQHSSTNDANGSEQQDNNDKKQAITLDPGETASVSVTVLVKSLSHLRSLNASISTLDDVLVLRVEDGRDHFVPVHANWIPSCFGRSIEELIRIPPRCGGIRGFINKWKQDQNKDDKRGKAGSIPYNLDVHSSSPPELYKLTEALEALAERVVADANMLQDENLKVPQDRAGWPFTTDAADNPKEDDHYHPHQVAIIQALETDNPSHLVDALPKAQVTTLSQLEILAGVLLLFLRSLTDGIVTAPLFAKIEAALPTLATSSTSSRTAKETEDDKTTILDILSAAPYHNISFVFVTSMLAKLASEIAPLSTRDIEALNSDSRPKGKARALSFRKSASDAQGVDQGAVQRRLAWEKKVAEIFGPAVCRSGIGAGATVKERKAAHEKMAGLVEIFLRRRDGG